MATLQLYPAAHPAAPPSPQLSPSPPSPPSLRAFSLTEVGGDVTRIPDLLRSYTCKRRLNRNISNGEPSTLHCECVNLNQLRELDFKILVLVVVFICAKETKKHPFAKI